jgi:hypothetical protein
MRALVIVALSVLSLPALARPARADSWRVSADVDLNTVAELGGSLWVTVKPPAAPHWSFGAGGFYTGVPSVFVELDSRNDDEGWDVRPRGVLGFAHYYFKGAERGFFVGAYSGYVRIRYTREGMAGNATIGHVTFEPHAGYQWFPFAHGFYVQPWLGFAILAKTDGSGSVGDETYAELPIVPLYGLNVGYELR